MKNSTFTRVSMFALAAATLAVAPAYAQDAKPADMADDSGDIVVTATREKTLLSKTPVAITAITGDALRSAGIASPTSLSEQVPNLSIDRTSGLQITIRGVTSTDGTEKGNPSAGFFADGIYLARPQEADVSFFDVNHVEVLRGPQGTRFGKNTTAGIVNVITNRPEFGKMGFGGNVGYGNYNAYSADGYVNVAAGDMAAFRLSASYDAKDSPVHARADDKLSLNPFRKNFAVRGQAAFKLGDRGDFLLRANYATLGGSRSNAAPTSNFYNGVTKNNAIWAPISSNVDKLLTRNLLQIPLSTAQFGSGGFSTGGYRGAKGPAVHNDTWSIDGELNYDFGPVKAQYLGSYRRYNAHENAELDIYGLASGNHLVIPDGNGGTIDLGAFNPSCALNDICSFAGFFDGKYKQTSHELRLSTAEDKPLQFTVGGYYFREESDIGFYIVNFPAFAANGSALYGFPQHTVSKTKAGYGEVKFKPAENIRLTAGMRYTDDDLFRYGHTVFENTLNQPIVITSGGTYANDAEVKGKKVTWRAGFDADVGKGLFYGSVSTGYKQGGFGDGCSNGLAGQSLKTSQGERCDGSTLVNPALPFNSATNNLKFADPQAIYYRPETLTAYEIGYRGSVAKGVRVDANIFYYDYKDMQLSSLLNINNNPTLVTTNAGKASVLGLELETVLTPAPNHQVTIGLDLTDAHYTTFIAGGDAKNPAVDFAGRKLDRSPAQVAYARYDWTIPMDNGSKFVASVGTKMQSRYSISTFGAVPVQYFTPGHSTTNASLTYHGADDKWNIQAFVKNIENFIEIRNASGDTITPSDPRTFGVRAGFKF
jgi:iron complex outermembrane recepter protein